MSKTMTILRSTIACWSVCLVLAGLPSSSVAAPADPPAFAIGSVNLQKVQDGYNKKADLDRQMAQLSDKLTSTFKTQSASVMLSVSDQRQLSALLIAANPTDAQKAQIAALQQKSAADESELGALQQKQTLTDADKTRLSDLTTQQQAGREALQQVQDDYTQQLQGMQDKLSEQLTETIRVAVAAVAKEKGLSAVFDGHIAIYTANDITADVIAKINK